MIQFQQSHLWFKIVSLYSILLKLKKILVGFIAYAWSRTKMNAKNIFWWFGHSNLIQKLWNFYYTLLMTPAMKLWSHIANDSSHILINNFKPFVVQKFQLFSITIQHVRILCIHQVLTFYGVITFPQVVELKTHI